MKPSTLIRFGAINMFLAISAGAFGAHALKAMLGTELLQVWQTAVQYHLVHGLGLILLGALSSLFSSQSNVRKIAWSGVAMLVGIALFCGSLYALALTGLRPLGFLTPVGGLAFLLAWCCLALCIFERDGQKA